MNINNNNKYIKSQKPDANKLNQNSNTRQFLRQKSIPINKRNNASNLFTILAGNLLGVMGINVNQTVNDLNVILSNKQSVDQLKKNIAKLIDITNPLIDETINQIIEKWNEGIKKMGQNLSMSIVEFIPILGQIIAEINSIQLIFSNFFGILKNTGDIVNTTLNSASNKYYREVQNTVAAPIQKFNKKKQIVENALVNTIVAPIEQINEQKRIAENAVAGQLLSTLNTPLQKKPILGASAAAGGGILSRIQNSVKNFMGKSKQITNTNKKITKTSKNISMKGGYNKNQNNIISQKGGQILSRIHKSLETFNNIRH